MKTNEKSKKLFIFMAGPCVIEDKTMTLEIAECLKEITSSYPLNFIFKASFDKANRTSIESYRGPGLNRGIKILESVKQKLNIPIMSDIHCVHQVKLVKDVLDVIQIPAFLSRQTDLIIEAARWGKAVNIKKGQFIAPHDVRFIVKKVESAGNQNILITERGNCFGYNNLVVDFRSFLVMREFGYPVIFDVTHSLQRPSAKGGISGGDSAFIEPLSLSSVACGVDGLFMEVHPHPKRALSDRHTSYILGSVKQLLDKIMRVREAVAN